MIYRPTSTSAIEYANANELEKWIQLFLLGDGNNKELADGLKLKPRIYHGPQMTSLDTFNRSCGPEESMKWQIDKEGFYSRVKKIATRYQKGDWDMPPLIVYRDESTYELNDGNHRYEALKLLEVKQYWVIWWETYQDNK